MLSIAQDFVAKVENVATNVKEHIEGEVSLFTLSDKKITELIYETHVHADESFDEDSLFVIVENILKHATQIIDKVVQGSNVHVESIEERNPATNFSVPLCTIKCIGSELSCKAPGEQIAHKTALSILHKLSSYSWEAKSVLTLAAFAYDFGDFWHLASLLQSDPLARQLAILRKVPQLVKPTQLQKHRQAILEVSNLIKTTMQVIAIFDEFEKLSLRDPKNIPELPLALDHMPVNVYWTIVTIAAIATKISILISDEPERPHDLAPYAQKIHFTLNKLNLHLTICRRQLAEAEAVRKLRKLLRTPTEVMEIFRALIFTKETTVQPLIDGSTNRQVNIEVLRRKNVFLFLSTLDITDEDIALLKPVYETTKRERNYTIVWIPIVEQWTDESRKKFDVLRPKIPWYILQQFTTIAGIKFIKEDWEFKGKPALVVLSPQGRVENTNAIHMIKSWGLKAFPFDKEAGEKISKEINWIDPLVRDIHPTVETWIKEGRYIFFYGGKDNEVIQQFNKKVTALQSDSAFKDIKIEVFCIGQTAKGGRDSSLIGRFWSGVESLFISKANNKEVDHVTRDIQKLLAHKNDSAWAVLSKGATVITAGHGSTFLKVIEESDKWKDVVKDKGFESIFVEHHNRITQTVRYCCHLDVPIVAGKAPDTLKCPECPRTMETYISYKCCHIDGPNGHH